MLDSLVKLRALVSMKTSLIEALRSDLETAVGRIMRLESRVTELEREQTWWKQQDEEQERQGTSIDLPVVTIRKTERFNLVEDPDAMWKKGTHNRNSS